jgi:hypothetical protein
MLPAARKADHADPLSPASSADFIDLEIMGSEQEQVQDAGGGIHLRSSSVTSVPGNSNAVVAIDQRTQSLLTDNDGLFAPRERRFTAIDPLNWHFYDERMKNLRRLLQMTFLVDMFTYSQARVNGRLGLAKYSPAYP